MIPIPNELPKKVIRLTIDDIIQIERERIDLESELSERARIKKIAFQKPKEYADVFDDENPTSRHVMATELVPKKETKSKPQKNFRKEFVSLAIERVKQIERERTEKESELSEHARIKRMAWEPPIGYVKSDPKNLSPNGAWIIPQGATSGNVSDNSAGSIQEKEKVQPTLSPPLPKTIKVDRKNKSPDGAWVIIPDATPVNVENEKVGSSFEDRRESYLRKKRERYMSMSPEEKKIYIQNQTEYHRKWLNSFSAEEREKYIRKKKGWYKKWYYSLSPEKKKMQMRKIVENRKKRVAGLTPRDREAYRQNRNKYSREWYKNLPPEKRAIRLEKVKEYQKRRYANLPPEQKEELLRRGRIRASLYYHKKREEELRRKRLVDQERITLLPPETGKQKRHRDKAKNYIGREEYRYEIEHQYDLSPEETKELRQKLKTKKRKQKNNISDSRKHITYRGKVYAVLSEAEKEKIEGLSISARGKYLRHYRNAK